MEIRGQKNNILVSAIVIAKNEAKKIKNCFETLKWCDEIILIDTGSVDDTVKIAKANKVSVYNYKSGSYSDWRNEGLKNAKGKWILYVDADEKVTFELQKEIQSLVTKDSLVASAYAIPRKNIILGKELKHGGWWPDYVKRLYKKDKLIRWTGELHEEPYYQGGLAHLKNPLIHIKHDNLSEMVDKTNTWSEVEARLMLKANHPPMNVPRFITAIFREFWLRMIKQMAFLDGTIGIIYAIYQVYSKFISYAKLWEMQLKN